MVSKQDKFPHKVNNKRKLLSCFIFLVGFLIFLYPIVNEVINRFNQNEVIENYKNEIAKLSQEELMNQITMSEKYNEEINQVVDDNSGISYIDFLDIGEVLGYIEIPKISVNLPIYQGITDDILRFGIGHIVDSSLPSEKFPTHVVLTGHRGLPTSTLFTHLNNLENGDEFSITYLEKKYTYIVDDIRIVTPNEVNYLKIIDNKNYTTLITCTPYMINSHRLLVRGELSRIDNIVPNVVPDDKNKDKLLDNEIANLDKDLITDTSSNKNEIESNNQETNRFIKEIEYWDIWICIFDLISIIFIWLLIFIGLRVVKKKKKKDEK